MSLAVYLFIVLMLGFLSLRLIRGAEFRKIDIFLIPGIGLGLSSQLVFYSLIFFDRLLPFWVISSHLIAALVLLVFNRLFVGSYRSFRWPGVNWPLMAFVAVLVLVTALMAYVKPYGDWDAWGFWNHRANFIFRAGESWADIFRFSDWWAHHPWLLPCMVIGGWSFMGYESVLVPIVIAMIFLISCAGLLMAALEPFTSRSKAFLAGVYFISVPMVLAHGMSQYADMPLAYFILAVAVVMRDLVEDSSRRTAVLLGVLLGLTALVKDNGLVACLVFMVLLGVYKGSFNLKGRMKPLILPFVALMLSVVLMKSYEALNTANQGYALSMLNLFDPDRWVSLAMFSLNFITDPSWGLLWLFLFMAVLLMRSYLKQEPLIRLYVDFIGLYILSYWFMFAVTTIDLQWLLSVSYYRLLFVLTPLAVFVLFCLIGHREVAKRSV